MAIKTMDDLSSRHSRTCTMRKTAPEDASVHGEKGQRGGVEGRAGAAPEGDRGQVQRLEQAC
jgi:hypothetical protein